MTHYWVNLDCKSKYYDNGDCIADSGGRWITELKVYCFVKLVLSIFYSMGCC